jgi:hypothetical protein
MQPISREQIRRIFNDSIGFSIANLNQIAVLCLPILFVVTIVSFALAQQYQKTLNELFLPFLLNLLAYPIYAGALIQLMFRKARHENPPNRELITTALRFWMPYFLLKTVMVALTFIGFLLIIPGIWMWVRFSFAEFYLVVFGLPPRQALQKSLISTKPYFGVLAILLFSTQIPIMGFNLVLNSILWSLTQSSWLSIIINTLCAFLGLFVLVLIFRIFMEAMQSEETS